MTKSAVVLGILSRKMDKIRASVEAAVESLEEKYSESTKIDLTEAIVARQVKEIAANFVRSWKGGKGSGYWGHVGRPGKVGGSAAGIGMVSPRVATPTKPPPAKSSVSTILETRDLTNFFNAPDSLKKAWEPGAEFKYCMRAVMLADGTFISIKNLEYNYHTPICITYILDHPTDFNDDVLEEARDKFGRLEDVSLEEFFKRTTGSIFVEDVFPSRVIPGDRTRSLVVKAGAWANAGEMNKALRMIKRSIDRGLIDTNKYDFIYFMGNTRMAKISTAEIDDVMSFREPEDESDTEWYTRMKQVSEKGGPGSGNFGHSGRPGKVGGSARESGGFSAGKTHYDVITETGDIEDLKTILTQGIEPSFKRDLPFEADFAPERGWERRGAYVAYPEAFSMGSFGRYRIFLDVGRDQLRVPKEMTILGHQQDESGIEKSLTTEGGAVTVGHISKEQIKRIDVYDPITRKITQYSRVGLLKKLGIPVDFPQLPTARQYESRIREWVESGKLSKHAFDEQRIKNQVQDYIGWDIETKLADAESLEMIITTKGGPGSGNFSHVGRPGHVGGSAASSGSVSAGIDLDAHQQELMTMLDLRPWHMTKEEYFAMDYPKADPGYMMVYTVTGNTNLPGIIEKGLLGEMATGGDSPKGTIWGSRTPKGYSENGALVAYQIPVTEETISWFSTAKYWSGNSNDIIANVDIPPRDIKAVYPAIEYPNVPETWFDTRFRMDRFIGSGVKDRVHFKLVQLAIEAGLDVPERVRKQYEGVTDTLKGGEGSGNFGHAGRPGHVGGSAAESNGIIPGIDTPEFKKWFDGSKIVDAEGNPLVVYHGVSQRDHNKTDFSQFNTEGHEAQHVAGAYFSKSPKEASSYARGINGNVVPVYLRIKNPADRAVLDSISIFLNGQEIREELIRRGYDGLVDDMMDEIVVFEPTQIKSIFNKGSFDPSDPEILKEISEKGGKGSGNFGHSGRPGHVGGSSPKSFGVSPGIDTPAFKKWFGNSVVVNADGTPKIIYHGTRGDFTEFDPEHVSGLVKSIMGHEPAYFFTDSQAEAGGYAQNNLTWNPPEGAAVMPVYIKMEHPASKDDFNEAQIEREAQGHLVTYLKSKGFDGIIFKNDPKDFMGTSPGNYCIVFDPENIKSVYNQGTFDPSTPHIGKEFSTKGGKGSGNFGHAGRPGKVGGSAGESGISLGVSVVVGPVENGGNAEDLWAGHSGIDGKFADYGNSLVEQAKGKKREIKTTDSISWANPSPKEYLDTATTIKNEICHDIAERSGASYSDVYFIIRSWAKIGNTFNGKKINDGEATSYLFQEAVAEEFGVPINRYMQRKINGAHEQEANRWMPRSEWNRIPDKATMKKIARAMYERTQEKLADMGYGPDDTIVLYRGSKKTTLANNENRTDRSYPDRIYKYTGNPIESWSLSSSEARAFGPRHTAMRVKVRNIFSTAVSGLGCYKEREFIIFGTVPGYEVKLS